MSKPVAPDSEGSDCAVHHSSQVPVEGRAGWQPEPIQWPHRHQQYDVCGSTERCPRERFMPRRLRRSPHYFLHDRRQTPRGACRRGLLGLRVRPREPARGVRQGGCIHPLDATSHGGPKRKRFQRIKTNNTAAYICIIYYVCIYIYIHIRVGKKRIYTNTRRTSLYGSRRSLIDQIIYLTSFILRALLF